MLRRTRNISARNSMLLYRLPSSACQFHPAAKLSAMIICAIQAAAAPAAILFLVSIITVSLAQVTLAPPTFKCAQGCDISLCFGNPPFTGGTRDGSTKLFRKNGENVGGALCTDLYLQEVSIGEPVVFSKKHPEMRPVRLSRYRPEGLYPHFPPNFVRTVLRFVPENGQLTFLTRDSRGTQDEYFHNLCLRILVYSYRKLNTDGTQGPLVVPNRKSSCVALQVTAPMLQVTVYWDTTDDLDLVLFEPSGFKVSRFYPASDTGAKLNGDYGGLDPLCFRNYRKIRRQESVWFKQRQVPPDGMYKALVEHNRNCRQGPTRFSIQVIADGILKKKKVFVSNKNRRSEVGILIFQVQNGTVLS